LTTIDEHCLRLLSSVCRFNRHGRTYQRERRAATNKEQTIARLVIDVLSASATDAEYIHSVITACRQRSMPPVGSRHVVVILTMTDHDGHAATLMAICRCGVRSGFISAIVSS